MFVCSSYAFDFIDNEALFESILWITQCLRTVENHKFEVNYCTISICPVCQKKLEIRKKYPFSLKVNIDMIMFKCKIIEIRGQMIFKTLYINDVCAVCGCWKVIEVNT